MAVAPRALSEFAANEAGPERHLKPPQNLRLPRRLRGAVDCHRQRDHGIDLVRLGSLVDPPSPRRLLGDRLRDRAVPLADRVGAELEALSQRSAFTADGDLVFGHPLTGKPLDRSKVRKRFKAAVRAAGVRDVRFHDLRHTFGTRMAAVGVPMRTLQEWMGHADFKTTLIYADYSPDERRDRDLVARAFEAQGSKLGSNLSETQSNSESPNRSGTRGRA